MSSDSSPDSTRPETPDQLVIIPEVAVPADYPDRVRDFVTRVETIRTLVAPLVDEIAATVLPAYAAAQALWSTDVPYEGITEAFAERTGWDDLDKSLTGLAGLLYMATGDVDNGNLDTRDAPAWWLRIYVDHMRGCARLRGDDLLMRRADEIAATIS